MNSTKISDTTRTSEESGYNRRRFLRDAAMAVGAAQLSVTDFANAQSGAGPTSSTAGRPDAIRPFHINFPDADLADLRRRVLATRWPEREQVADASQGVQLATMQKLARYWGTEYDWRKGEAKLKAVPHFVTEIDGLDIHFIHVRSKHVSVFPDDIYAPPQSWTEKAYSNLIFFNKHDKGGHFAAWEQPAYLTADLRAAFKTLR